MSAMDGGQTRIDRVYTRALIVLQKDSVEESKLIF